MALSGEDDGERSRDGRYSKRQRLPTLDEEEEDEDDDDFLGEEDEEEEEEVEDEEEEVESEEDDDVTGNDIEDITPEIQSESPKLSQSVKLQSSDVLDCPTCCEPLKRPIYQCTNGHLACSSCCKKLNKRCSFCRSHIGDIRCRAMEKVIEATIVPCPNAKYGCKETTAYGDQSSSHEKVCFFVRCFCPMPKCDYVGSYTDLKTHARVSHTWDVYDDVLAFDTPLIFNMNLGKQKIVVFKVKVEGDLIVVQAFKGSQGVYVTVNHIAPLAPGIKNFSCSLAKLSNFSTIRIGSKVKKVQKVAEKMHLEDDVLWIPPKMLSCEHWKMQICIGTEQKYIHI